MVVEHHRETGEPALGSFHLLHHADAASQRVHSGYQDRKKSNNRVMIRRLRVCRRAMTRAPELRRGAIFSQVSSATTVTSTRTRSAEASGPFPSTSFTSRGTARSLATRVTRPVALPYSLTGSEMNSTLAVCPSSRKAASLAGAKTTTDEA